MSINGWIRSITASFHSPWVRLVLLTVYYGLIIAAMIVLYGKGDLSSSEFVYQGF
jgi:hypothetical protein